MSLTNANSSAEAIKNFIASASITDIKTGGMFRLIYNDVKTNKPMIKSFNLKKGGNMIFNIEEYKPEELPLPRNASQAKQSGGSVWAVPRNGNILDPIFVPVPAPIPLIYSDYRWIPGYGYINFAIQQANTVKVDMISKISKKVILSSTFDTKSDNELKRIFLDAVKKFFDNASNLRNFDITDINTKSYGSGEREVTSLTLTYQKIHMTSKYQDLNSQGELFEKIFKSITDIKLV